MDPCTNKGKIRNTDRQTDKQAIELVDWLIDREKGRERNTGVGLICCWLTNLAVRMMKTIITWFVHECQIRLVPSRTFASIEAGGWLAWPFRCTFSGIKTPVPGSVCSSSSLSKIKITTNHTFNIMQRNHIIRSAQIISDRVILISALLAQSSSFSSRWFLVMSRAHTSKHLLEYKRKRNHHFTIHLILGINRILVREIRLIDKRTSRLVGW